MNPRFVKNLGRALSAMCVLLLAMDAVLKIIGAQEAIAATQQLGFQPGKTRALGWILGSAALIYAIPRTALLGAVLLTGYLGGAIAVHFQHGSPLVSHVLFGVYIGIAAWAGLWLRMPQLRSLLPFRSV